MAQIKASCGVYRQEQLLNSLKRQLAQPNLDPAQRAELERQLAELERELGLD
ncbi:MAG: hypothetical protein LDL07_11690 [Desulfarculus sp.]|nr:hypothetical protein [Desulfarculus sp.]